MSLRRVGEEKALIVVRTSDGGGKQVEAPPQKVVEEETFVDAIGSILDRDFFPELPKLRAYNEWLDAVQARDHVRMSELRAKWRKNDTRHIVKSSLQTPALQLRDMTEEVGFTEPKRSKTSESSSDALHEVNDSQLAIDAKLLSLDEFLGKYTSEDDASFSKLMEKEVTEARRVYNEIHEKAAIAHSKMATEGRIAWKQYDPSHSSVFSTPRGLALTFTPEEMMQGEKAVIPENTRFPEGGPRWNASSDRSSSSTPQFKVPASSSAIAQPLDAQLYDQILKRRHGSLFDEMEHSGPQIGQYPIVSTPKISANNVDQSPMITWGEIADEAVKLQDSGLPVEPPSSLLAGSETHKSGFSVPSLSEKQLSANHLLKKATKKRIHPSHASRIAASPSLYQSTPSSSNRTPLFQNTPDTQLRSSYATPKFKMTPSNTSTPTIRSHPSLPNTPHIKR